MIRLSTLEVLIHSRPVTTKKCSLIYGPLSSKAPACETALGRDLGGEGLVGLTRAFQYAGARTAAAMLWKVDDEATAELMVRFYGHLRDGKSKDEALRAAQIERIRHRDPAPYYWAAFQLYGDWR